MTSPPAFAPAASTRAKRSRGSMTMTQIEGGYKKIGKLMQRRCGDAAGHGHRAEDHARDGRVRQGARLGVRRRRPRSRRSSGEIRRAAGGAAPAADCSARARSRPKPTRRGRRSTRSGRSSRTAISIPRSTWRNGIASARICVPRPSRRKHRASFAPCSPTCSAASASRTSPSFPRRPTAPATTSISSGQPGFDVRLIDRQLVVSSVDPDGGAAAAGVHAGMDRAEHRRQRRSRACWRASPSATPPRLAQVQAWRLAVHAAARPVRIRARRSTFVDGTGATGQRRASSAATSRASRSRSAACPRCSSACRRR